MIEFGKGLDEEKIKMISSLKKEPDWMLSYRLDSYKKFKDFKRRKFTFCK